MLMKLSQRFCAVFIAALVLMSGCAFVKKRPPYPDPDRLVSVIKVSPAGEQPISGVDFLALRNESKTLDPIAAYVFKGISLDEGEAERVDSAQITADFFQTLGVEPILGRALLPVENQAGKNHVAAISYRLWQRRFSGDSSMIGRTITLDHELYTIVGVMPHDFQFPKDCDLWTPLVFNDKSQLGEDKSLALEVVARLKPGGALDQSQAEVSAIAHKLGGDHPENAGLDIKLTALRENSSQKENAKGKVLEIRIQRPANQPVETGKEK
jgi:putative ABC transport system permease protein